MLKTESSNRLIPIHHNLINLGLLEFVKSRRDGHLWIHLTKDKYGNNGRSPSRWLNNQLRKLGIKNKMLAFHSCRHTVIDQLKQKDIPSGRIKELTGHIDKDDTTGRYGKSYHPKEQLSVIEKLDIPIISHNENHNWNENDD